jgi:transcriptional regulator of acetoin/glycerol metabolism
MSRLSTDLHRLEREMRGRFEVGVASSATARRCRRSTRPSDGREHRRDVLDPRRERYRQGAIAKVLHLPLARWSGPFIAINCSAIPRELLESELFGHERGAFTGATEQRPGKFELRQAARILLDEIADMPLELQAKLLRVPAGARGDAAGGAR